MAQKPSNIPDVSDAIAAPIGDMIAAVGRGLAEAQLALDMATIAAIRQLYSGTNADVELLRRLGYQPTFYRIPELTAELTLSLTVGGTENLSAKTNDDGSVTSTGPGRIQLYASPMDANYTNRYDYDLEAASVIKFRIVPVPPTSQATDAKVVPNLAGKTYGLATARLRELGIAFEVPAPVPMDTQTIKSTTPPGGEFVLPGSRVIMEVEPVPVEEDPGTSG